MTKITGYEAKLASLVQRRLAHVKTENGEVWENDDGDFPFTIGRFLGRIRTKFIPNRKQLGLKGRYDWEHEIDKHNLDVKRAIMAPTYPSHPSFPYFPGLCR